MSPSTVTVTTTPRSAARAAEQAALDARRHRLALEAGDVTTPDVSPADVAELAYAAHRLGLIR